VNVLGEETVLAIFPAIARGISYLNYKIYIVILTESRFALIYHKDFLPKVGKLKILGRALLASLIGSFFFGLPGVSFEFSLDSMGESELLVFLPVYCRISSRKLDKVVSSRRHSYCIWLDDIKRLEVDFENSTFKLKVGLMPRAFIFSRGSISKLAYLLELLS